MTGPGSGVAVAPDGTLMLVARAGGGFAQRDRAEADVVHRVDAASGQVLDSWGAGELSSPHGVDVAPDGSVWVTDVGSDEVVRFSADGEVLARWGSPAGRIRETCLQVRNVLTNLPCPTGSLAFARPTDVAVAEDGTVYVADGYRNSRVVHLSAEGEVLEETGELGDDEGQFFLPHGIDLAPDGSVHVAERRNARVQVLDADLEPVEVVDEGVGRPYDVHVDGEGRAWVLDGGDGLDAEDGTDASALLLLGSDGQVAQTLALPEEVQAHQLAVVDGRVVVASLGEVAFWTAPLP